MNRYQDDRSQTFTQSRVDFYQTRRLAARSEWGLESKKQSNNLVAVSRQRLPVVDRATVRSYLGTIANDTEPCDLHQGPSPVRCCGELITGHRSAGRDSTCPGNECGAGPGAPDKSTILVSAATFLCPATRTIQILPPPFHRVRVDKKLPKPTFVECRRVLLSKHARICVISPQYVNNLGFTKIKDCLASTEEFLCQVLTFTVINYEALLTQSERERKREAERERKREAERERERERETISTSETEEDIKIEEKRLAETTARSQSITHYADKSHINYREGKHTCGPARRRGPGRVNLHYWVAVC
ncbi:hypothetical protein J6590_004325 [Homalodisca vitripennis]|nr:hypothetical protein J6590_004325 [Homalodisca vitripennis]